MHVLIDAPDLRIIIMARRPPRQFFLQYGRKGL